MAVSRELLDILVCPLCKVPVTLVDIRSWNWKRDSAGAAQPDNRPYEEGLKCGQCRRVYPIADDIPVMLIDEAKIEPQ